MNTLSQNLAQRARIILSLADGLSPKVVGEDLKITAPTVFKWRRRYHDQGIAGLEDAPRQGQPRKLDQKAIKDILDKATREVPREATHWSLRLMARVPGSRAGRYTRSGCGGS